MDERAVAPRAENRLGRRSLRRGLVATLALWPSGPLARLTTARPQDEVRDEVALRLRVTTAMSASLLAEHITLAEAEAGRRHPPAGPAPAAPVAGRGGPGRGPRPGPRRLPAEDRVPVAGQPRAADPAQRHPRLRPAAPARRPHPGAVRERRPPGPGRPAPARADQRDPGHLPDRDRQPGPVGRGGGPAGGHHRDHRPDRPLAAEREITLEVPDPADCRQVVQADRQRLRQVLLKLTSTGSGPSRPRSRGPASAWPCPRG